LMSSVRPPSHMTSGWMISTARFSMSLRKPYLTCQLTSMDKVSRSELTWNTRARQW
jgi:O-phosphoseryl-tRNA(Cys) synthetase